LLGFLPLCRRVSQDISCVLVHGYSSCDLGLLQLVIVAAVIVYGSSNAKKFNMVKKNVSYIPTNLWLMKIMTVLS
jgi:hypothetical protein